MARTPTIVRSLVWTGNYNEDGTKRYFAEWSQDAPSFAAAVTVAEDSCVTIDDCHDHTIDGQRYLDIGGPVVEARQQKAAHLAAIDEAISLLQASRRLVKDGMSAVPGAVAVRNVLAKITD